MNLKIKLVSKPQITFSKCRIRVDIFKLLSGICRDGSLDSKTKELLGLVASTALRCNDCIDYHLIQCVSAGWEDEELFDALNVALVVGGSIVIPHLRHVVETIDTLRVEVRV